MNQLTVSLWGDESFTAVAVQQSFGRMLAIVAKDTAPPLYYICLFIWTRLFGPSEISIRLLSVLFYLGTVVVVYLIARKIWNHQTGLLASLLLVANPFLFPFAFEGRMYAILVFFVTLSFYFFISKNQVGYILATAAALYSHHYAALAVLFQFFWAFTTTKNLKKNWFQTLKPYLFIGLLYLPWLYPLYRQVTLVAGGFWLGKPLPRDVSNLYLNYLRGSTIFAWQKWWPLWAGLILLVKKWSVKWPSNLLLLGWAVFPALLAYFLSQGKTSLFYDRYLIYIIPVLVLLLAGGWRRLSLILIGLYCLPLLWTNFYYFNHPTKRPFRELATYVKQTASPSDFLINWNGTAHHLWESKYYGLTAPLYAPGDLPYYIGTAQMTENDLVKNLPKLSKIGVISSQDPAAIVLPGYILQNYKQFDSLYFSWFDNDEQH
jgi:4-amino-4-deoxy-L-arabinose transferase-like glycosyltransferase